jgi:phage gp36-like protein
VPTGPYVTLAQVRDALAPSGSLTPGVATAASLSDAELTSAIADAQTEVDARLQGYSPAPFDVSAIPPIVTRITRDIAAYLATLTFRQGDPMLPDHPVSLRYAAAQALLTAIAKGTMEAPGAPVDSSGVAEEQTAAVINPYETWRARPGAPWPSGDTIAMVEPSQG